MKRKYLGEKSLKDLIDFIKGDLNEKINTKDHITEDKTIEIWNSITGAEIPNANSLIHNHNELYYLKSEIDRMLELLSYNDIGADPAGSAEAVQTNLTSHANDRSNPHEVTCEQISALPLTGGTMSGTIISDLNNSDDTPELQSNLDNGSLLKLYVNNKNNKASIRFGTDDTLPPEDDKRITLRGLKDPVDSSDGVNKAYVDNAIMHYGVYDTSTSIDGSDFVAFKDSSEDTAKKISLTDLKDIITNNFAICDTEANIAEKIVTIPNLTIRNGTRIIVYFANNNSIEHPTLNVNGIGPLEMKYEAGHFTDSPINIIYNFLQGLNEFVYIEMGDKKYWYRSGYMEKAYSATRLHNYRSIDGVKYNGNNDIYHFGVCTTAANVSAKTVSLSNTFVLTNGSRIAVYFEYENTAAGPTLNVNGTGAGYISCNVGNYATNGSWTAKTIVEFVYYNQHWVMLTSHATRLSKARNIQTNLASTSTASFDGTANVTPGVTGILPIANGGTGATTAASALAKLGGLPLTGGTLTGNLTIKKGNYGNILNFGDGDYVHISEPTDDNMEIKAKNVNFVVSGDVTKNGSSLGGSMNRSQIEQKLVCNGGSYINTVAIGHNALSSNTSSSGNTAVGRGALSKNTSGNYNTAIGYSALASTTTYSWTTGVGYNATVTGDKQVQLGDSDVTVYAQRSLATRSDRRDKVDINDSNLGLNFITKLRPVSYRMNPRESYFNNVNEDIVEETDEDGNTIQVTRETVEFQDIDYSLTNDCSRARKRPHYGLIAQEVKEVMNELDIDFAGYLDASYDGGEDVLSLSYTEFIAPMIKAIQEQQEMINELKKEVELLKTP